MEPRPSRPNRSPSSASRSARTPWVPPEGADDLTAPRTAEIYGAGAAPSGSGPSGGPWYGPRGSLGPEPPEYRATKPPMPIKPRGERGNRWLRYLLGAILLALAVGGTAFAITWFLDDDDPDDQQVVAQATATATAESASGATQTPETLAQPTATSDAPPEPSPTAPQEETPVQPTEEAAAPESTQESANSAGESSGDVTAEDYLPATSDLDGAWEVQAEGVRTQAEVGEALGEGGEDALLQFGWQENAYRDFGREAGDAETFFISVSVHRFDTAEGASEGLTYFSDVLAASGLYQDAGAVEIGDAAVAMEGSQNGANLYALYVLDGNVMIRFGGSSLTGDPAPFVDAVAEHVVASA